MNPTPTPKAPISPAQFELKRLRDSIRAAARSHTPTALVEALQAVEHLFEIVLPDPGAQPQKPPIPPAPSRNEGVTVLPDGSTFATMSLRLPADHWLYAPACEQWDRERDESADLPYPILSRMLNDQVVTAARWAIRAATARGQEVDFDPDALVQNFTYALCGPAMKVAREAKADHFTYTVRS